MKKIENFYLTIQSGRPESNKNPFLLGFFCSFLLFFFSCASFVLNFSLIFSPDFSFMRMVELCMILGFGGALLFSFRKTKRFFLLFFGTLGILLLFFLIFRADFFRQFSSALGAVENQVKTVYNFSLFPGYSDSIKDKLVLLIFFLIFYLLMTLFVMLWKNTILFVLLLFLSAGNPGSGHSVFPASRSLYFMEGRPVSQNHIQILASGPSGPGSAVFGRRLSLYSYDCSAGFSVQRGLIFLCQYDRKQDFIWK